jgi:hypothetical protein
MGVAPGDEGGAGVGVSVGSVGRVGVDRSATIA